MDRNSIFRKFRSNLDTGVQPSEPNRAPKSLQLPLSWLSVNLKHLRYIPIFPWSSLSVNPGHPLSDISVTDKSSVTLHQQVIPGRSDREEAKKIPGIQKGNRGSENGDYLLSHLRSTIGVTKLNFSVRNGKRWNLRAIVTWISHVQAMLTKTWSIYQPPCKESERAISNARLWCLHLYTCILSTSSSLTTLRNLILRPASHLDAFSAYPIPT